MKSALVIFLLCAGCASIHRVSGPSYTVQHYSGRPDGLLSVQTWAYTDNGRGFEFGNRGSLSNFAVVNSNLLGLGGVSTFGAGAAGIDISSNAASVVTATGAAVGSAVGTALKAAGVP